MASFAIAFAAPAYAAAGSKSQGGGGFMDWLNETMAKDTFSEKNDRKKIVVLLY